MDKIGRHFEVSDVIISVKEIIEVRISFYKFIKIKFDHNFGYQCLSC